MKKKIAGLFLIFTLVLNTVYVPVGAIDLYIPENLDGTEADLEFYTETACLISEYWDDDYFESLFYSSEDGACKVNGEWYLPVRSFCSDAGITYSRSGKKFTISTDEFSWKCKVNNKNSELDGSDYTFQKKPIKRNGLYMINAGELDENSCFEVEETDEGVSVTRPYQMKRLIVETKKGKKINPDSYGAVKYTSSGNVYILQFDSEKDTKAAYDKLSKGKKIENVEPDRFISMIEPDAVLNGLGTYDYGDSADWNISMIGSDILAGKISEAGIDRKVTVAVVDTGVDYTHSYLKSSVKSKGYDFINNDYDAFDDNGHGTHVAGIIVNTVSGANVDILPVKVLSGQGSGSSLAVSNGIIYAAQNGADVINLSLGGASYGTGHYEDTAIQKAIGMGSVVVVAAGNDNSDTAYECPAHNYDAIVVSAIDSSYNKAYFSNYGNSVDLAAPGVDILSSVPGNGYEYWSGTSMATPHVSGLSALLKLVNPSSTCSKIESILRNNAIDLGSSGFDVYYGYGLAYVGNIEVENSTEEPTPVITPTSTPVTPTPAPTVPVITPQPTVTEQPTVTPQPTVTAKPTVTPQPTVTQRPTATPVPTKDPVWPTYFPITDPPIPTMDPIWPTFTPYPIITPAPTITPKPTAAPVITQPAYSGNTSCSISCSSGTVNGVGSMKITISTGGGIRNVYVAVSDGTYYDIKNEGNGINKNITINGSGIRAEIKAYDYYGNVVSSGYYTC